MRLNLMRLYLLKELVLYCKRHFPEKSGITQLLVILGRQGVEHDNWTWASDMTNIKRTRWPWLPPPSVVGYWVCISLEFLVQPLDDFKGQLSLNSQKCWLVFQVLELWSLIHVVIFRKILTPVGDISPNIQPDNFRPPYVPSYLIPSTFLLLVDSIHALRIDERLFTKNGQPHQ